MNRHQKNLITNCAIAGALALLGTAMVAPISNATAETLPNQRSHEELTGWRTYSTASERDHGLIGFGCGATKEIMTATEEDHFPRCEVIEPVDVACPNDPAMAGTPLGPDGDEWLTAAECANFYERDGGY